MAGGAETLPFIMYSASRRGVVLPPAASRLGVDLPPATSRVGVDLPALDCREPYEAERWGEECRPDLPLQLCVVEFGLLLEST